ncbi:MAG: hypothetical protein NT162_03400 [Candidatus Woesebacteria bacterium]|nr:hypothetical protein [Candidatus Woesebacteria bacterium]
MKVYDRVLQILNRDEKARNSDKYLIWEFWVEEGKASKGEENFDRNSYNDGYITQLDFRSATSPETIRRIRQKIQETHPELAPTSQTTLFRRNK